MTGFLSTGPYDPHRTVSAALTEVRTLLRRAQTAIRLIEDDPLIRVTEGEWDYSVQPARYVPPETIPHPDADEMIEVLKETVEKLKRWERAR